MRDLGKNILHSIRLQLQEVKQNLHESIEEYAESQRDGHRWLY